MGLESSLGFQMHLIVKADNKSAIISLFFFFFQETKEIDLCNFRLKLDKQRRNKRKFGGMMDSCRKYLLNYRFFSASKGGQNVP